MPSSMPARQDSLTLSFAGDCVRMPLYKRLGVRLVAAAMDLTGAIEVATAAGVTQRTIGFEVPCIVQISWRP